MARILDEDTMEAFITSRTAEGCSSYSPTWGTSANLVPDADRSSSRVWASSSARSSSRAWASSSARSSYASSPYRTAGSSLPQSISCSGLGNLSRYGTAQRGQKMIMSDVDKTIYNSLGSSSSPMGKQTYSELGLQKGWKKRGIMWKTGPNPSWLTPWKKRYFVLKGNFLYYFACQKEMTNAPVLGAIYLKNAVIKKESMGLCKTVLKVCPSVPRRKGYLDSNDGSSNFYLKFKSTSGRDEWYEELQQVSFENEFPMERGPLINSSMEYTSQQSTVY